MLNVLTAANRSNQRGGRMLSVVDLVEAGTLTAAQAVWLLARILQGSSWLVGARPGGAGKTTVMAAMLAMLPRGARVWLSNRGSDCSNHDSAWQQCNPGDTIVSYELSPGFYDAYIWGQDVIRLTELGQAGCRIVSNLHADTLEQARRQVVGECGATEQGFQAFQIFIPLVLKGSRFAHTPIVEQIDYVHEGRWCKLSRKKVGSESAPSAPAARRNPTEQLESTISPARIAEFLECCCTGNIRLIEDVREAWLEWCDRN
jgi:hypothetical protein